MAIIYTYPTKATLALADKVLISDSADANKTKNATITSIKDAIDVVDTFSSAFGTYITGTANAAATGAVDIGTLDLSAVDGTNAAYTTRFLGKNNEWLVPAKYAGGNEIGYVPTGGTAGNYLDGAGTWSTIDLTTDVNGILPASSGGTGGGSFTVGDLIYYGGSAFTRLSTNGVTDGFVLTAASGVPTWAVSPSANPGGTADNQIQYKNGTAFAASSNITVAGVPNILVVRNIVRAGAYNGNQGKLEVFSNDNNTSVSLQGPPNGGSNYEIRMPSTLGTANQVLKLPSTIPGSGASQLTWGDAGISGTLAVSGGGTGNNTIGQYNVFVGTSNTAVQRSSSSTDAIQLPSGTTAQAPSGVNGMLRYDTNENKLTVYENGEWRKVDTTQL